MGARTDKAGLTDFLQGAVARQISLEAEVVVRRQRLTVDQLRAALDRGDLQLESDSLCQLEVGGQVLAVGQIEQHEDGEYYFVADKESKHE